MNSIWFSDYRTNKVITFTCISKSDDVLSLFVEAYIHVPYEGPDYPIEISFRTMNYLKKVTILIFINQLKLLLILLEMIVLKFYFN